jgi:hypothetical protein
MEGIRDFDPDEAENGGDRAAEDAVERVDDPKAVL